ncbi:MAG: DUF3307 domain-containing protein [Ginsengibacter sp.]
MILLVKLLLAHLVGDFLLQPGSWVAAKEDKKLKAWQLYAHVIIHFLLIIVLVWDIHFILWALLLAALHLMIDIFKITRKKSANKSVYFFVDQGLHLLSIYLVWVWYGGVSLPLYLINDVRILSLITLFIFITIPTSIIIRVSISKWTPHTEDNYDSSLQSAGKYIGILERVLIVVFIIIGQWEGVGFLLAAKSIFRFGDLKASKDRKLTEYILIGTLLSFGMAILSALAYKILIANL